MGNLKFMKSAYELAMERLEQKAPSLNLSEAQKAEITEIESVAKARTAEKELFLGEQIQKVRAAGNLGDVEALEKQLASERRRIREDAEAKKERVRQAATQGRAAPPPLPPRGATRPASPAWAQTPWPRIAPPTGALRSESPRAG